MIDVSLGKSTKLHIGELHISGGGVKVTASLSNGLQTLLHLQDRPLPLTKDMQELIHKLLACAERALAEEIGAVPESRPVAPELPVPPPLTSPLERLSPGGVQTPTLSGFLGEQ